MPKIAPTPPDREAEGLSESVGRNVLEALGRPGDLQRLQVKRLWDNHFRVNIHVGEDPMTARLAHSFFLVADGDGAIVASTPPIAKQY